MIQRMKKKAAAFLMFCLLAAVMPFGAPVLSAPACEAPESGGPSGRFTAEEEAQVR